jgi:hypothetical protein
MLSSSFSIALVTSALSWQAAHRFTLLQAFWFATQSTRANGPSKAHTTSLSLI